MTDDLKSLFRVSEIEITYRNKTPYHDRIHVDTPGIAHDIFRGTWDTGKMELLEQFKIMLLDNKCNCLGISHISSGGMNYCFADAKLIFATALTAKANRLILAHNHPSGYSHPSDEDKFMTRKITEGAKLLEMSVLDHLILTQTGYYSFADNGEMPGMDYLLNKASFPSPD